MHVWSGAAYRSLEVNEVFGSVARGYGAGWSLTTPSPVVSIVHLETPPNTVLVDCMLASDGFSAAYFWGDNGTNYGTQSIDYVNGCHGGIGYADGISRYITPSRYFGWSVSCSLKSSCEASDGGAVLALNGVQLEAQENTGPTVVAAGTSNVWYRSGWIRGSWPATLDASDASGVCAMQTSVDGQAVASWNDPSHDLSSFIQCHGSQLPGELDTTKYADGQYSLTYAATNAAGVASAPAKPILIDNTPVGLSLSGPADAPVTAGTQYLTATASAGPSGVAIACSVDNAPYQWHFGASAQIPVAGLGEHRVACYAQNSAVNPYGVPATSSVETWAMTIREPTVFAIGFSRIVNALRCHRVLERVTVPAHWVTVRRHHKLVRVHKRPSTTVKSVTRCHLGTAVRRVTVRRIPFGHGTTVSGWLGTSTGMALAGQTVHVLAAANNGQGKFVQTALVTTAADGSWSAHLRPGPSRLIEALYGGTTTTEPAVSGQAMLIVPAKVLLRIQPMHTHWRGTIQISGRVLGGHIPSGKLLRLRIGAEGVEGTVGIPDVGPRGRFRTTWTFASGNGTVRYWFSVSTLQEADYPYAASSSARVYVSVGPG